MADIVKNATRKFSWEAFEKAPVVGIVRGFTLEQIRKVLPIYEKVGFSNVEVTMNTEGATDLIRVLCEEFPNLNIGAGTVCNIEDLHKALEAGSQFIVTPIIDKDTILYCKDLDIPIFPGAFTPTEIYRAWNWGASAVKVFPSTALGVGFIKDVLAPLNEIKLLPTGGVSKENIASFLKAGAIGAGMGGSLFDKSLVEQPEALEAHFQAIYAEVQSVISDVK